MKKQKSAYGLGIISIFLIFAVLCLTVFASLAVSSARADLRLSEKNADYVKRYYAATAECAGFVQRAKAVYPGAEARGVAEGGLVKYDITFDIDGSNCLHAVFAVAADGGCEYLSYEVISLENAGEPGSPLHVWQP